MKITQQMVDCIRAIMRDNGWDAAELTRRMDAQPSTVWRLLSGKSRSIHDGTAEKLILATGIDPVALARLGWDGVATERKHQRHEQQIAKWLTANPEVLDALLPMLRTVGYRDPIRMVAEKDTTPYDANK